MLIAKRHMLELLALSLWLHVKNAIDLYQYSAWEVKTHYVNAVAIYRGSIAPNIKGDLSPRILDKELLLCY